MILYSYGTKGSKRYCANKGCYILLSIPEYQHSLDIVCKGLEFRLIDLHISGGHMSPPQPRCLAEEDEVHRALDGGPPSAGVGRWSGPSAPARKGRVRHHLPRGISSPLKEIPSVIIPNRLLKIIGPTPS
jgi:hypothetical protein